ncbi:MAG: tRNA preQ1(34) S-adenosylmethionine ribosyltransferase-isomerase QueA [Chloroflexi bacterium]|nr:tRNA preQ1(34) S-adenosylmethionine ribosyltransferase-isomerase QueA [Chloroflexota bacterium]
MNVADFDYDLPPRFIAQTPLERRDSSRLMRLDRATGAISHHVFSDIGDMLRPGDVLVLNNTRVIPARLRARKATGGRVEILLLKRLDERRWNALVGGRNIREGAQLAFDGSDLTCSVARELDKALRIIEFSRPVDGLLCDQGEMPLPPYINLALDDAERYQTVYSAIDGSAAAPTAGLHFTRELLDNIQRLGVRVANCTLHIGLDTFQPVTASRVEDHKIHSEFASLNPENAAVINESIRAGGRVIAVGTTSARTLETAAGLAGDKRGDDRRDDRAVAPFADQTSLFITPGYRWRAVDALVTNFHLPRSTLLMMLSAFAGRVAILRAYESAKRADYRFYSFGDAMFVG